MTDKDKRVREAARRVSNSIELLDEAAKEDPLLADWRGELVKERGQLDMVCPCSCVLGLLYAWHDSVMLGFSAGVVALSLHDLDPDCLEYAFSIKRLKDDSGISFQDLENEWNKWIDTWEAL